MVGINDNAVYRYRSARSYDKHVAYLNFFYGNCNLPAVSDKNSCFRLQAEESLKSICGLAL